MSKRMTSETIIFDTDWLTEADFSGKDDLVVSIDYQAYDTLKIIVSPENSLLSGGLFQEFDVYRLENFGPDYRMFLEESEQGGFNIEYIKDEGSSALTFYLDKNYWENELDGVGSIYIKGVKR